MTATDAAVAEAVAQGYARLRELGFDHDVATVLVEEFADAERRGRPTHGLARIDWLTTLPELNPKAEPERVVAEPEYELWDGRGAVGYLTLARVCDAQLANPPRRARIVIVRDCSPTGSLGYRVRQLARGGLVAMLTANSWPRLASPSGGPPLAGTNAIALAIPSSDGFPLVADVGMGAVTYGDVILGRAAAADLVPFGGEMAHKAFALAVGTQTLVAALAGETYSALLIVATPASDPVPALRALAGDVYLPGDGWRSSEGGEDVVRAAVDTNDAAAGAPQDLRDSIPAPRGEL